MLKTITACFAFFLVNVIFAQEKELKPYKFEKITVADFRVNANQIDSSANAVVIADVGLIDFIGNKNNWVSYVFKKTTRIKIINKNAYDLATIIVPLYGVGERLDKIDDINATTYNIEDGKVTETKLAIADLIDEKISKNITEKKFTMPNIKEGSIIEYSYTITSYHFRYLPDWAFQYLDAPCLYSELRTSTPDMLRYLTIAHGADSISSSKLGEGFKDLIMDDIKVSSVMHNHIWIMKDIPAFKYEGFINQPRDYIDKIEFSLVQTYNGREVDNTSASWKATQKELIASMEFGGAIDVENASALNNAMLKICKADGDILDAAKNIFYYVRDNFTCVPDHEIFLDNDLYKVNQLKKGSVADLNLLLIALLRQRHITAYPVILSTKGYGVHPENYPVLEKMNYAVCMIRFGTDSIYLDASDPKIAFGKLPLKCYNGHAQIIDDKNGGSVYFYPSTIKNENLVSVFIGNDEKGNGMSGNVENNRSYYSAYKLRKSMKSKETYEKEIALGYGTDAVISNFEIDSLSQLDNPIKIGYDISFKNFNGEDILYFNPIINQYYKENPFKAAERRYPVEMDFPTNETYLLNMEIPKGYVVEELPKSAKVGFNGNDGVFEYIITKDESSVQLRTHIKLNQAVFPPEDYQNLRDFFAYVVKKQSEQIVFKKIK